MAEIELRDVGKSYGALDVLRGISLSMDKGEFVVLVGPSGCGKSTLLRMIAGLEEITEGEITIGGRVVNDIPSKQRDIAMVFQSYALYPHMKVADNMSFALRLAGAPKAEIRRRVAEAAEILGLEALLDRLPRDLSGGQRQRVAMGRAIVRDPRAFLFDEPLSNLDAKLRVKMRGEIKKLHQRLGRTTIYVTHDQTEAMTMADTIVVMNAGQVEQAGPPLRLYEDPDNAFVAGFVGSPEMNLLQGQAEGGRFRSDQGLVLPLPPIGATIEGRRLTYGLRPQHIRPQPDGIEAVVELVEPTGDSQEVELRCGATALTMLLHEYTPLSPGDQLRVGFDAAQVRLFDAATSLRVR
ncbi:MAG: Maltose/maltodextrin transport ATP-binding protein MalK [uncultured Rubellimicrobium sp.]|uniref:Maltose/maltodextrin transport ATP-binding protein MalK n=1 Tax=uncultured Rubellimicrobium sp. TaxID=543078 RepID=A0A6J4PXD8_9RHOB|nr:MAG: Maltose/maltodextrin transport ATP-binding protein MalK [uncultured Rubellimicrobium sp.]